MKFCLSLKTYFITYWLHIIQKCQRQHSSWNLQWMHWDWKVIFIQMKKRDVFFVSLKLWTIKSTLFCSPFNFNSEWFEAVWSSPCFISLDSSHRSLDVYSTLIYLRLYTTSRYSNLLGLNNLGINYFFMLATHY